MKRILSCLLILALCVVPILTTLAAAESEPSILSYDDLADQVISGNAAYQKELQEIQRLEHNYSDLAMQFWQLEELMYSMPPELSAQLMSSAASLSSSMRTTGKLIDEMKDALDSKVVRYLYPAQKIYINHYILLLDMEIALRELNSLERELETCRLKLPRGLCTQRDVRNAEKSVDNQKDLIKAKQDLIDNNLESLAKYLGLAVPIDLEGMPEIEFDKIKERDLTSDLAAYILAACAAEEKAYEQARKTFSSSNTSTNRYLSDIALQDFNKAKKDAEANFPKVYEDLLQAYNDFLDSTLVSDAQEDYDLLALQYKRGLISLNALQSAEQMLELTKSRYEQQRIQLCLLYMEYEYNLIKT